jgi:ABC-type Na+ efflux pump permease subunit
MSDTASPDVSPSPARKRVSGPLLILGRVWTLAASTFTQLVRMRTFYFILLFAFLIAAASNLDLLFTAAQKLRIIKETSLGAMSIFAWLYAIVATAMLIPRDLEDRTLYTILAKPVSRFEYLLGKLLGVLLTIGVALLVMLALFTVVLWARQQGIIAEQQEFLSNNPRFTAEEVQADIAHLKSQGVGWNLLAATWAIFLKSSVVVAMTILISTFASSSLFTIIVASTVFLIGHFHKISFSTLAQDTGNPVIEILGKLVVMLIPDFRTFNIVDTVAAGTPIANGVLAAMGILTAFYLTMYILISLYLFFDKEF